VAPGAAYCRACGARHEEPAPAPEPAGSRSRAALWVGAVIVLVGAGAALAILLARGGDASRTTVVVDRAGKTTTVTTEAEGTDTEAGSRDTEPAFSAEVDPGLYVQAGSFRTLAGAEEERERLAAAGIDVSVLSSDGAADLYPGFQVLFGGPISRAAQEGNLLEALDDNGVDGFARDLSPAPLIDGAGDAAGRWTGTLDRTSGERPNLNDSLPVTVSIDTDGEAGTLETAGGCDESLSLKEEGPMTLTYFQDAHCVSGGDVFIRPAGSELMVAMLPLDTDVFVTGTLGPG
jgi:SPOR domain